MKLHDVKRNFAIWTIVTIICATPSFRIAVSEGFNMVAMLLGISIVILGYTYLSSSPFYQNVKNNKVYFNKALKIAFCIKIASALITLLFGYNTKSATIFAYIIDIYAGIFAIWTTTNLFGYRNNHEINEFLPTLLTTLSEALIMSLFILFVAILIWIVIRIWRLIFKRNEKTNEI